jgi:hypothetical protein
MFVSEVEERAGLMHVTVHEQNGNHAPVVLLLTCLPGPDGLAALEEALRLLSMSAARSRAHLASSG